MLDKKVAYLLIDDNEIVLTKLQEGIKKIIAANNQVQSNHNIFAINPTITGKLQNDYNTLCKTISNKINNTYEEIIVLSGRDLVRSRMKDDFVYENINDLKAPLRIDRVFLNNNERNWPQISKDIKKRISKIFIYSYSNDSALKFHQDAKKLVKNFKNNKIFPNIKDDHNGRSSVVVINTSLIFRLYPYDDIYKSFDKNNGEEEVFIGTINNLEIYGDFITSIAEEIITDDFKDSKTLSHYSHLNSLKYNKFIDLLNELYFNESEVDAKYKLSTVSALAKEIDTYLLDVPYRDYYVPMNNYIVNKNLAEIFEHKGDYKKGCNYFYFSYFVTKDKYKDINSNYLFLDYIVNYEEESNKKNVIYRHNRWNESDFSKEIIKNWLSILDASIFYNQNTTVEGSWREDFPNRIVEPPDIDAYADSVYQVEILWFYHDIKMEEYGLHSSINYTFFRVYSNSKSLSNQNPKKRLKDIDSLATKFYNIRRPIVISKAKQFLFPYFHDKAKISALQSAVSQIFARNYAHNIGSHVAVNANFEDLEKRVQKLYGLELIVPSKVLKKLRENVETNREILRNALKDHPGELEFYKLKDLEIEIENINPEHISGIDKVLKSYKKHLYTFEIERNEYIANPKSPPKNSKFFTDILCPFVENTLLMDNLCNSESVNFKLKDGNKLRIRSFLKERNGKTSEIIIEYPELSPFNPTQCKTEKDEPISYPFNFPYLRLYENESDRKVRIIKKAPCNSPIPDFELSIRNEHSFYSILENFIRNSSKHNSTAVRRKDYLDIIIDIEEKDYSYTFRLLDNVSKLTVKDVGKLFVAIQSSLLDENSEPRTTNLGLSDKRINVHLMQSLEEITEEKLKNNLKLITYQRNTDDESVYDHFTSIFDYFKNVLAIDSGDDLNRDEIKNYVSQFISGEKSADDKTIQSIKILEELKPKGNHIPIGFEFELSKSKKVCWIGDKPSNEDKKKNLNNNGVYFYDSIEEMKASQHEKLSLAVWDFVILEPHAIFDLKDKDLKKFEESLIDLPFRILVNKSKKNCLKEDDELLNALIRDRRVQCISDEIALTNDYKNILDQCWINWLKRWNKKDKKIYLYLLINPEKYCEDNNTNAWQKNSEELNKALGESIHLITKIENDSDSSKVDYTAKHIVYDHHGGWARSIGKKNNLFSQIFESGFYQPIGKNSEDFVPIYYPPEDNFEQKMLCYELIEAGLCKVVVMDERLNRSMFDELTKEKDNIAHWSNKTASNTNGEAAYWANVFQISGTKVNEKKHSIFQHENKNVFTAELNIQNGLKSIELDISYQYENLERFIKNKNEKLDVLIIHRTFLQKSFWGNESCEEMLTAIRKVIPFVIVISGGGSPNMDGTFKFKSYNTFKNLIENTINKWSITKHSLK